MEPVRSNLTNKNCIDSISSNCIDWAGPQIPGTCGKASLTDVVSVISEKANCCEGSFPTGHFSCYTGSWVNFTSSIITSGTTPTCTWVVNTAITNYGPPQYKWTREGDLKIRGGFRLTITPTANQGGLGIQLVALSTTCFPTGWTASQFNVTAVDPLSSTPNITNIFAGGVSLDYPSGVLYFGGSFSNIGLTTIVTDISLGGTTLNLA